MHYKYTYKKLKEMKKEKMKKWIKNNEKVKQAYKLKNGFTFSELMRHVIK